MPKKLGVVGSLVWDVIHGRDPLAPPVEEWGGIAYALGGLDASLPPDWEIVPLIKVGRDLAPEAGGSSRGWRGSRRAAAASRCRCPTTAWCCTTSPRSGAASGWRRRARWTWAELGPMVPDLDALYLNFISGFELCLGTAQALRQGFRGPIYADLHSLFLGMQHDGIRVLQPLADAATWFGCFDVVQLNEDEMQQLSPDPLSLAAQALGAGVSLLVVTLGPKGAAYVAAPGFDGLAGRAGAAVGNVSSSGLRPPSDRPRPAVRTALDPGPAVDTLDPTGCGDVFGAAACARLLAGDAVEAALRHATAHGRAQRHPSRRRRPAPPPPRRAAWSRDPRRRSARHVRRPLVRAVRRRRSAPGRRRRRCCSTRAARSGPRPSG